MLSHVRVIWHYCECARVSVCVCMCVGGGSALHTYIHTNNYTYAHTMFARDFASGLRLIVFVTFCLCVRVLRCVCLH